MADRAYLSIGEVLSLLKDEFPDITISKIRFLESQGLLDPERTPSGYRKFYEADVERLRWILQQQRENFLPLKVIKGRLGVEESAVPLEITPEPEPAPSAPGPSRPEPRSQGRPENRPDTRGDRRESRPPVTPPPPSRPTTPPPRERPAPTPAPAPTPIPTPPPAVAPASEEATNYTLEELGAAAEIPVERLAELEKYGLLAGRKVAGSTYYDEQALHVAKVAAGFLRFGVEARHLRMYKTAAEREASFFEQIVMPMLKQRNPEARRQAIDTLSQLGQLGGQLRIAMLREALRQYTTGL